MGFFEDTKPPEPAPVTQQVKQDWLAVLVGGFFAILGMLLLGIGKLLWAIFQPYIAWCTNIEGRSKKEAFVRFSCLASPILLAAYFVYQIPYARDFISLKETHTLNRTNGYRIIFPDRSFFVTKDMRSIVHKDGSRIYIAYAGYTENVVQEMESNQCQLVPRSEKAGFSSLQPPVQAEGFEDEISYPIRLSVPELHGWRYASFMLAHREYWFKKKEDLTSVTVVYETSSPWSEFVDNWDRVYSPPNLDGNKPFKVKALPREHAIVCF